jgi:death-on-curing protein
VAPASAKNIFYDASGDWFDVAAGDAFHLAESQAVIDGNKRTAVVAALVFRRGTVFMRSHRLGGFILQ